VIGIIFGRHFLGLFSLDAIVVMPLPAFQKYFSARVIRIFSLKYETRRSWPTARDELTGLMRRVRGLPPEKKDDFQHQ